MARQTVNSNPGVDLHQVQAKNEIATKFIQSEQKNIAKIAKTVGVTVLCVFGIRGKSGRSFISNFEEFEKAPNEKNVDQTKITFFTLANSQQVLIWSFRKIEVIQRLIQNLVKHLRWRFVRKMINDTLQIHMLKCMTSNAVVGIDFHTLALG